MYGPVAAEDVPAAAKVNGIMCRPKPNGSVRIILNMSSPEGNCVNVGIDNSKFPAKMSSTKKWLKVINKAGRGALMAKYDICDAYKQMAGVAAQLAAFGFKWLGKYFYDITTVFGSKSAPANFDSIPETVVNIVCTETEVPKNLVF